MGGEGARERCRRLETGEREDKDGGDDGTCSESCDGVSWAERFGMAVRFQGGEKEEKEHDGILGDWRP